MQWNTNSGTAVSFNKSQYINVCIFTYFFSDFLSLSVFEIEAVKKRYGRDGLGSDGPGRFIVIHFFAGPKMPMKINLEFF